MCATANQTNPRLVFSVVHKTAVPEKLAPPRASERRCANKAAVDIAGVRLILSKCALCVSMCIHEQASERVHHMHINVHT